MSRNVKGVLFVDYVRMLRSQKAASFPELLDEDRAYLTATIEPNGWYPMATFERMGDAILRTVAGGDLRAVRMWGRFSVDQLRAATPLLVSPGDPIETLMRFRVLRATFFDFEALTVITLAHGEALVEIRYFMGQPAEEAASMQTMGFFERLLEVAGAERVDAELVERVWAGDPRTLLALTWK